jgi:hypothetical protein
MPLRLQTEFGRAPAAALQQQGDDQPRLRQQGQRHQRRLPAVALEEAGLDVSQLGAGRQSRRVEAEALQLPPVGHAARRWRRPKCRKKFTAGLVTSTTVSTRTCS